MNCPNTRTDGIGIWGFILMTWNILLVPCWIRLACSSMIVQLLLYPIIIYIYIYIIYMFLSHLNWGRFKFDQKKKELGNFRLERYFGRCAKNPR